MKAKRVLFVCTGNTCRSPMAEGILRARMPAGWRGKLEVTSAGTFAGEDEPASPLAVEVSGEIGVDLSGHRARRLSAEEIERADLVVVMAGGHEGSVVGISPDARAKIIYLGELDDGRVLRDIDDPIGGDRETYVRIRDEIHWLIDLLIDYLAVEFNLSK